MPAAAADLRVEVRWVAPMTMKNEVLEDHSVVVRNGRILDILPTPMAIERYSAAVVLQRASHLAMPGMVNAHADAALLLFRGLDAQTAIASSSAESSREGILAAIAEMLRSGITCFADRNFYPEETARAAGEQGMRAMVGMPVAEAATPWGNTASASLTRSLKLRDEYRGHPLISTAFAVHAGNSLRDDAFSHLATLADELDAGITMELHQSAGEIRDCIGKFGVRPIERMWKLGLLTPALNAVHMAQVTAADIDLAQRMGISVSLCPQASLKSGNGLPPAGALAAAGIRLSLGSAGVESLTQGIWGEMRLIALLAHASGSGGASLNAWDVLHMATRGGAAALGLADEVGTLEAGKWADLACVDLSGPATQPLREPLAQLVFNGGRDLVSDVWVAGRQLLLDGNLTRLEWSGVAARAHAFAARMSSGG
jgi:5-methylthioadenosine/S-adenosylhomocysteine deaminase